MENKDEINTEASIDKEALSCPKCKIKMHVQPNAYLGALGPSKATCPRCGKQEMGPANYTLHDKASLDISDLLPRREVAENFKTADTSIPEFIKEAAYEPGETQEESIKKDWERLIVGLSDYVLAEQLTEYELRGMGKPVGENYAAYFQETLKSVKKGRKKAEEKLFKFIPKHSQLDSCGFFETVAEQCEKEKEAREKAMEEYPFAGVEKLERKDVARADLKKEAAAVAPWVGDSATKGMQTNYEAAPCMCQGKCSVGDKCLKDVPPRTGFTTEKFTFCMPCHDAGCSAGHATGLLKEAAKWQPGQHLRAKWNNADAYVAHVDEQDKIYVIKTDGVMSPSYYSYEDAHDTFTKVAVDETKDGASAQHHGLS